jgi:hypothetical protein
MVNSLAFLPWGILALGILASSIIVDQEICNISIVKMTCKKFRGSWLSILALQRLGVGHLVFQLFGVWQ